MKRPALVAISCLVLMSGLGDAAATEVGGARRFGLGFAIGEPVSLVGKYFLNSINAIDFGLAFARFRRRYCTPGPDYRCERFGYLSLNGDYLWEDTLARERFRLNWHIGPGARLSLSDDYYGYTEDVLIFARMPVGLDFTFDRPEFLEVFVEIAPALLLLPEIDFGLEAFVGVRFYF
jgi:hypothetical protein